MSNTHRTLLEIFRRHVSYGQVIREGPMAGNKGCSDERADELINEMSNVELLEYLEDVLTEVNP